MRDIRSPSPVADLDIRNGTVLYMEGVSVSFDGYKAIDELNFYVNHNELRCVIGPNGAGKTTMMDIITGKTRPDEGQCWFGSRLNLLRMKEDEIARSGIGRKFQKPTVFDNHSVFENMEVSADGVRSVYGLFTARLSGEVRAQIESTLELIGLADESRTPVARLSHGQKQWLELGMLLMQNPMLLLIDEPAAGMTHDEMDRTIELLTQLKLTHSVVVVEHDMDFVRNLESPITVLHQGSVLAEGKMQDIQEDPKVIEVYLGS